MRINKTIDDAEAEIIRTSRQLKANVRKYSELVEKVKESSASLAPYEIALEETCNIMLCRYRDANIKARQSAIPLSFSEYVCLTNGPDTTGHSVPGMDDDRLGEFSRRIHELRVEMGKARQKMINLQQRVSRDLESVLDEQEPAPEDLARQLT
jgi:phosphate uptake regulator